MRFTLIKNIHKERSMVVMLTALLLSTLLYLGIDIFVKQSILGVTQTTLSATLFGDEQEFIEPISQASFLEYIHGEIFFMMMLLLTLSAAFIRVAKISFFALLTLNINLISALLSLLFLALAYFYSEIFVLLYLGSFFLWHALSVLMSIYALWRLHAKIL